MSALPKIPAGKVVIRPEKNEFDDHFLDVIGTTFKFDHAKGLAELIKNSADAYATTADVKDAEQYVLLRFRQGQPKKNSVFECIDFVGMTKDDIGKALKVWGLASAAKKGTDVATYGGHGNGGKFYMRQMFETSMFITYRTGMLNVFGFDAQHRYGFARGLEDKPLSLEDALKYADLGTLDIPKEVRARWKKRPKAAGFTVVRGMGPHRFRGKATVDGILEKLRVHPQARRLLAHKQVSYLSAGQTWGKRLTPPVIEPHEGFTQSVEIALPKEYAHNGEIFQFRTKEYPDGKLILKTSEQPLSRAGEFAALNAIDIIGEVGCIGSYRMMELGVYAAESEFVYGECQCPLLEDEAHGSVTNDREKLVDNDLTRALLHWISEQLTALAEKMGEKRRAEKKTWDLKQSSLFNQLLDRWKNKFMAKLTSDLFGGIGIGDSSGGTGGGGTDKTHTGTGKDSGNGTKNTGDTDTKGGGSGDEKKQGPRFPQVLLSGFNQDPLDEAATKPFECDPRHPPVYQRDIDVRAGIYWINTSRPLADKLREKEGANSARWREYLFQRYVDIILKQSLYEVNRIEGALTPERVDQLIDDITSRVHDAAAEDLESFLFDDKMTVTAATIPAAEDAIETTKVQ